jgi:hypothetical protein
MGSYDFMIEAVSTLHDAKLDEAVKIVIRPTDLNIYLEAPSSDLEICPS